MDELRIFRRFVLPRNNARDVGFTGKLIATNVDEGLLQDIGRLTPPPGDDAARQPMAALFQTASGKYIAFCRIVNGPDYTFILKTYSPDQIWQVQEFFLQQGSAGKLLLRSWGQNTIEELD